MKVFAMNEILVKTLICDCNNALVIEIFLLKKKSLNYSIQIDSACQENSLRFLPTFEKNRYVLLNRLKYK